MESSCFICGHVTTSGRRKKKVGNLKGLLTRLCELLSVSEVSAEDWQFLEGDRDLRGICCGKCGDILESVERIHEILLKTQEQLTFFLDELQMLIVESEKESQKFPKSGWNPACFGFRRSVIARSKLAFPDDDDEGDDGFPGITIKMEQSDGQRKEPDDEEECGPYLDDDVNYDNSDWGDNQIESVLPGGSSQHSLSDCSIKITSLSSKSVKAPSHARPGPASRKRKFEQVSQSEDQKGVQGGRSSPKFGRRSCSSRIAKKRAEEALKQRQRLSDADEEDDDIDDDGEYEAGDNDMARLSRNNISSEDDDDGHSVPNVTPLRGGYQNTERKKPPFNPFLVAEDDLYLYRWAIYVRNTYTHLECLAHKCTFKTTFDYYPSFQRMKDHIETNHRSRKYIRETPHICHLCNSKLFPRWKDLWGHIRTTHKEKLQADSALQVCEGCLMFNSQRRARIHFFTHKNAEEQTEARLAKEGPARLFQLKESEITERNFVCDQEDCEKAFKTQSNLDRHRRSHLPPELRTDMTLCPECGKQVLQETLSSHMDRMHHPDAVKNVLICEFCKKRFLHRDRSLFEAHLRRHKGIRPYLCPECGSSFVTAAGLNQHILGVHQGKVEPVSCELCGTSYTCKGSLQKHLKKRHPEKYVMKPDTRRISKFYCNERGDEGEEEDGEGFGPVQMFPCELCETLCKYKSTLRRHMKSVHGSAKRKVRMSKKSNYRGRRKSDEEEDNLQPNSSHYIFGTNPVWFP